MHDLISIVMPAYNSEKYIRNSIKSVINQTYKNWELIIIDDYSTDNTVSIIEEFQNKNIHLIKNKKNSGAAISRNKGIKLAKGNYIAFLDSDDLWNKEKLEKQINFMKSNNYDFTYTSFTYLKERKTKKVIIPEKLTYKESLKNTIILTSTVMINLKNIQKKIVYMPNIRKGQDTATWWNILKNNYIAHGLNMSLTKYRVHKNSLSNNKIKALIRTWKLYRKVEKFNIIISLYYFINYISNAIKKRI